MYALVITENEYPCGNVYGIFDSYEKASIASLTIKTQEEDFVTVKIIEFELNSIIYGSLTSCANCMSSVIIEKK